MTYDIYPHIAQNWHGIHIGTIIQLYRIVGQGIKMM